MKKFFFKRILKISWVLFILIVPAIIIQQHFTKIFECPSCYLYQDTGDGLKNYYTLAYYVEHDNGWNFSGMNYPYGEHIIYTDNQPILAFSLRWIDRHITDMGSHVVGTLNILLLLSIYLAVFIIYTILKRWGAGKWWAFSSSICIIFLSPQLLRFNGHYGLAYVFFIPLLILLVDLLIRDSRRRWLWGLATGIFIVASSLTHMYFLILNLVLLTGFASGWLWYHRREKKFVRSTVLWLAGVIVIPVLVLIGIKTLTDDISDRPVEPWGIDNYTLTFHSTFLPFIPPFDSAWANLIGEDIPNFERIAYTGFIGLILLPAVIYFLIKRKPGHFMDLHVKSFLIAGIVCWIMGAGVLYQNGFKFLWEFVPVLKQFRGLGRFGMPFYYLYTIVCSYLLWSVFISLREKGLKQIGNYILTASFILWSFESYLNFKAIGLSTLKTNKSLNTAPDDYVPILTASGFKADDFQAILQFPLVAIGNETFGVSRGFWTFREGIHASMETGLPMIDYVMSRTSISQGLDLVQLISSPYTTKTRVKHFDERPILLVCEEEFMIPAEKKWLEAAHKLGTYQSITLYNLPSDIFRNIDTPYISELQKNRVCDGWFDGFDQYKTDTLMSGTGALSITTPQQSIWSFTDTSGISRDWIVSFWSHVDNQRGHVPFPTMSEIGPDGIGKESAEINRESIWLSEAYREWIQISFPLRTSGKGYTYDLSIEQTGAVIDNLLIAPYNDTCIIQTSNMLLYNNIPIESGE